MSGYLVITYLIYSDSHKGKDRQIYKLRCERLHNICVIKLAVDCLNRSNNALSNKYNTGIL